MEDYKTGKCYIKSFTKFHSHIDIFKDVQIFCI